ncbi:hypothetical protein MKW98_013172 [Papaver atlanticum]|uniref:Uncharacterized protein n=1 Tax=Papaver atlanticum TaxID=357466 RepID=A0AAD4XTG9_9MAGN|nr:hypothetical protein MKW98_013172 [Papaver atlanticum]
MNGYRVDVKLGLSFPRFASSAGFSSSFDVLLTCTVKLIDIKVNPVFKRPELYYWLWYNTPYICNTGSLLRKLELVDSLVISLLE